MMIKRMLNRYCLAFLIITIALLLGSSLVAASDIDDGGVLDDSNMIESDNTPSIIQDDNSNSQTEKNEVITKSDKTDTTTSKELTKTGKNLKGVDISGTLTMNATSGYPGDVIALSLFHTAQIQTSSTYNYKVELGGTVYDSGTMTPTVARYAYYNFTIPDVAEGEYLLKYSVNRTKSMIIVGSDTFTVLSAGPKLTVENETVVQGEFDNFILPVNIRDGDGNAVNAATDITITDGDEVLVENYPVTQADNNIPVDVKRTGEYSLTVIINATGDYAKSTCMMPVNVAAVDTILTVDDNDEEIYSTINVLTNTVITGSLTSVNGKPVRNVNIKVVANGQTVNVLTDDDGYYSYQYPVTEVASDIPISVSFEGFTGYNPAEGMSGTFDVETVELVVTFDEVELSEVNETTTISGEVVDTFGVPLDNAEFNLTISGVDNPVAVTSTNGTFSYGHVFTQAGTYTVTASRDLTSGLYEMDEVSTEFTTVIGPRRTTLTVDVGQGSGNTINITGIEAYTNAIITTGQLLDIFSEPVANADITVLVNDNIVPTSTDADGNFQVIYNATQGSKDYNISIRFDGNDNYKQASEVYTGTFTTDPIDVKVVLNDDLNDEYLLSQEVYISGQATLIGSPYNNEEIIITINGVNHTAVTDENGQFTYTYTTDTLGETIIKSTESTLSINVIKPEVSITLNEIADSNVFVPLDIKGNLIINSNQTGVADTITLTVNDESFDVETDADGTFTYTYTPTQLGLYNVAVSFDSIQYTTTSTDSKTFNVEQLKTRLVPDELPIAVKVTEAFTISGKLLDQIDRPIADAEILITVNDEVFTTTTDSEGVYSYDYQASAVSNNNLYEVRYSGDEEHDLARNYVGSFFDVEQTTAYITVEANDSQVNTPINITGVVSNSKANALADVNVEVKVNNEVFETTTDIEGVYTVVYTPKKAGQFNVIAAVDDEIYPSQSATTTFNVAKAGTTITVEPVMITTSYNINLTATVTDSNNNPVTGGKVVFKINGKTVKDDNGKVVYIKLNNGSAVLAHTFTQDDIDQNVSITASYSGTTSYDPSNSAKFYITKAENVVVMTLDDITATAGEVITPAVSVKYNDENVDDGKVIFKINGKTIKDENGKVIYANVADGVATCDYTIPSNMKAKSYTLSAVFTSTLFDRTEATATLKVVEDTVTTNGLNSNKPHVMGDGTPKTIIINNDTIATYITETGLTDLVTEGDTLDFQGTISGVTGLGTIIIDKPVNIITSTNDGRIELFNNITYTRGASGSNVTGLFTFNTQFFVVNADNMVFDNISNVVDNKGIGSQVGQTSIREICTNITVKNSLIKTINNGGFSSLVFTYVSHSYVLNNTIIGEGRVGNLFYFNTFNAGAISPDGNSYNVVANNTIIGPDREDSICYGIQMLAGRENLIENNTINYPGDALRGGSADTIIRNNVIYAGKLNATGIITNNTIYNNGTLAVSKSAVVENNTIHGTIVAAANSVVRSNVADYLQMGNNVTVNNVTINNDVTYVVNGSTVSDSILENSTIGGNIEVSTANRLNIGERNKIQNNNITGNITVTRNDKLTIANNTINGTINVTNTKASNTLIEQNNITTANEYTIINYNNTTTIRNNQLITPDATSRATINDISGEATIIGNGPAYRLNITMENYDNYFDENGVFNKSLNDETLVVLHGEFSNVIMNFNTGEFKVIGYDENTILNNCILILSGSSNITVENITFIITEDNAYETTAIKVQSDNNNIINNTITVTSPTEAMAILVENAQNIAIRYNTITVYGGYAVNVLDSTDVQITENYMNTTMGKNNYAVHVDDNSANIQVADNTPGRNEVEITFDSITGVVLDGADITINIIDTTDSSIINDGTAYIMINGEILKDADDEEIIFNVENGQISLTGYEIPSGWLRSDAVMTIVYIGSNIYENATIDTQMNIAKREANIEILSEDVTASIGDTITLQARITDGDNLVTNGKVAFKLNGNSLEDESGTLIYVNLVDGIATLEYTFTSQAADTYELTAVFENMLYYRAEDSTTLTIEG